MMFDAEPATLLIFAHAYHHACFTVYCLRFDIIL